MGLAYLEVEYEIGGRRYRTVHGAWSDATLPNNTFGLPDYENWGGEFVGDGIFDDATDPANDEVDPRSLIEAVLYMHRAMQGTDVILRNLSINDGATPGDSTGNFVSVNLDLQCRGNATVNSAVLAGLNTTMAIVKQPAGFSKRKGRMFLRGAIAAPHIQYGDRDGVTFQPGFRAAYSLALTTAIGYGGVGVATLLRNYLGTGNAGVLSGSVAYVIPNTTEYTGIDPDTGLSVTKRALSSYTFVQGLDVTDAQSRKTTRRKKQQ